MKKIDEGTKFRKSKSNRIAVTFVSISIIEIELNYRLSKHHYLRCHYHISLSLAGLHWLRVPERVVFKLAMLVYRCLHGIAPCCPAHQLSQVADMPSWRRLRSSSTRRLDVPLGCSRLLVIVPSLLLLPGLETVYPTTLQQLRFELIFVGVSRRISSASYVLIIADSYLDGHVAYADYN
jgi:hypothetical protein